MAQHAQRRLPTKAAREAAMSASFGLVDRKVMALSMAVQELSLRHIHSRLKARQTDPRDKDRLALAFAPKVAATVHLKLRAESEESRDTELDALLVDSRAALTNGNAKRATEQTIEISARPASDPLHDDEG